MKLLFIDLETSGLNPKKHGVIQIAGIVEIDGEEKERFDLKCSLFSGQFMDSHALAVNGITEHTIRAYPEPSEAYEKLIAIFDKYVDRYNKADKFYMVGQNPSFDYAFLEEWFNKNGNGFLYAYINYAKIDLIGLTAAFTVGGIIRPENMKLATIAKLFDVPLVAHDAMSDIEATRAIFHKYIQEIKNPKLPLT